jgi:hypothetical protein
VLTQLEIRFYKRLHRIRFSRLSRLDATTAWAGKEKLVLKDPVDEQKKNTGNNGMSDI